MTDGQFSQTIDETIAGLEQFQRETKSEHELIAETESIVERLGEGSFTAEQRSAIENLKGIADNATRFVELQEDMEVLYNMDDFMELMGELTSLAEHFDGFQLQKRINKEIRELNSKRAGLKQTETSRKLAKVESKGGKCQSCGHAMRLRKGKEDSWFYGCAQYPFCSYTRELSPEDAEVMEDF